MINFKYCPICKELLEESFIEGKDRQHCKECGWIHYLNPVPVVSCLVSNGKGELLLIKRGIEPCLGAWALPGGYMEIDETSPEAGARELLEETGLDGIPGRLVGLSMEKSRIYGSILTIGIEYKVEKYDLNPGDDAEAAAFFDTKNLPKNPFKSQRELVEKFLEKTGKQ